MSSTEHTASSSPGFATGAVVEGHTVVLPPRVVADGNVEATSNPTPNTGNSPSSMQEEGVLRDVLSELDRERSARAELEAQVRKLEEDLHSERRKQEHYQQEKEGQKAENDAMPSFHEFIKLKTECQGYVQLLEALTLDRPVFQQRQQPQQPSLNFRNKPQTSSLPLHVVRLLEILPWDERAQQHLFGSEDLYEWQIYSANKTWQTNLRQFPHVPFKTLPIVVPQPDKTVGEAPTTSSPPKQCVLTNVLGTRILNIDKGYPLPQDGGDWQWVGGWRIEMNNDTDDRGWSYSNDPNLSLTEDWSYYSELRIPKKGSKNIVRRRRKWIRTRVLVDYPQASPMTKAYLKLVAEKARLDVSVDKLSHQLVETKMSLTRLEAEHLAYQEETTRKTKALEKDLKEKNQWIQQVEQTMDIKNRNRKNSVDSTGSGSISGIAKRAQVNELRSVVTQWVSNTVNKRPTDSLHGGGDTISTEPGSDEDEAGGNNSNTASSNVKQQMFESLRGTGSGFLDKIKQRAATTVGKPDEADEATVAGTKVHLDS